MVTSTHFALLFLLINVATVGYTQDAIADGKKLYEKKCKSCHGASGTKGRFGARNLQATPMNDTELYERIREGKGLMPSWKRKLTAEQIRQVISYIRTLKQKSKSE
jgi:mono/diheme cytochrome c family protein